MGVICTQEQFIIYIFESTARELARDIVIPNSIPLLSKKEITGKQRLSRIKSQLNV